MEEEEEEEEESYLDPTQLVEIHLEEEEEEG